MPYINKPALACGAFCLAVFTSVFGATAPAAPADEDVLQTVVVTATKFQTSLMKTAVAVSAVGEEEIERDGIRDMRQLGALVPNMQVGFSPSDSGVQVTIRGITSNNFTELGDPTVGIHFDGIYTPRSQAGMALMHDVERIEVLRGPQGTLFGRNSTAGAINILAKRPQLNSDSAGIELQDGNYNDRALRVILNKALSDSWAFRFAFGGEVSDSYIKQVQDKFDLNWVVNGTTYVAADGIPNTDQRWNTPVKDSQAYGAVDRQAYRASLLFDPGNGMHWQLTAERYVDRSPGAISMKDCGLAKGTTYACTHDQFYASINVPGLLDMGVNSFRSELSFVPVKGMRVEYRVGNTREDRSQQYDGDGGAFADPNSPAYGMSGRICCGTNFGPLVNNPGAITALGFDPASEALFPFQDLQLRTRWSHFNSWVQELQVKSDGDGPLRWVGGIFDMREKNSIRFDVDIPWCCNLPVPLAQSFVQPDRRVTSTAAFGQLDYAATDKLNLTAGYRYTWDQKSDLGGHNYSTIGYFVNPGQFDPSQNGFWEESWGLIGIVPGWAGNPLCCGPQIYQSNALTNNMGTSSPTFLDRTAANATDNTYQAKWSKGTWKVGFDYTANKDLFYYGSIATGFKAGGFGDKVDVCNCGHVTAFPYKPETDINFELGLKKRFMDGKLNFIGTVFDTEYKDMQRTQWVVVGKDINTNTVIGTNLTANTAESRIRGIELELDWLPWRGGRITGWVTRTNAVITKDPGAEDGFFCFQRAYLGLKACPAQVAYADGSLHRPTSFVGNKLPWSPDWSSTINVEHSWYLANGLRLSPYASVHWQSKMFFNDNNFDQGPLFFGQKGFATGNIAMRLINERSKWGAELYVYNVTNEYVKNWADPGPGYMKGSFFPPRMFGAKFRYGF
jgi:iron complex outermembrane receptor protein